MSSQPAPTRTLPPQPSLAQLRKQANIERDEENRHARTNREAASPRTAFDALRQAIANGSAAEAIALMEADPVLVGACDVERITPLHLAAFRHDPAA